MTAEEAKKALAPLLESTNGEIATLARVVLALVETVTEPALHLEAPQAPAMTEGQ